MGLNDVDSDPLAGAEPILCVIKSQQTPLLLLILPVQGRLKKVHRELAGNMAEESCILLC